MPAIVSRRRADLWESRPRSNVARGHAGMARPVASPTSFESVPVRAPTRDWCCTNGSFFAVTDFLRFDARHFRPRARLNKPSDTPYPGKSSTDGPVLETAVRTGLFSGVNVSPREPAAQSCLSGWAFPRSGVIHRPQIACSLRARGCIARLQEEDSAKAPRWIRPLQIARLA